MWKSRPDKKKQAKEKLTMAAWWQTDLSCLTEARLFTYSIQPPDYSPLGKMWQATVNFTHTAGEYKSFTLGHITPQLLLFPFFLCLNMLTEQRDTSVGLTVKPDSDRRESERQFNNAGVASATADTQHPSTMTAATSIPACTQWRAVIQFRIRQKQQCMCIFGGTTTTSLKEQFLDLD